MSDFCPVVWPEEPTPEHLQTCNECGLDKHGSRMVWGEGNPNAPIMVILDNPGAREDREGNPFVCGTRQTLQKAANRAELCMKDIYVTFILKRKPVRAYNKEKGPSNLYDSPSAPATGQTARLYLLLRKHSSPIVFPRS